jgi:hypothetical protein
VLLELNTEGANPTDLTLRAAAREPPRHKAVDLGVLRFWEHEAAAISEERETPRHKAVVSWSLREVAFVAGNMKLHGTRPWYLGVWVKSPL